MNTRAFTAGFRPVRHDQLRPEREHDAYKTKGKLRGPAACPKCGAVYHEGQWRWLAKPVGAKEVTCPACQRMRDHYPAGFVSIEGSFFGAHRDELMSLIRHHEQKEKTEHPLARIMAIEAQQEGVLITTTDIHLAREIGEALHHAYQGELEFHYNEAENLLRVHWRR